MDGHALDLPGDCFDIVASEFSEMLFPDLPRGLREMVRVAKPGGRVVVVALGSPEKIEFFRFFIRAIQAAVPGFTGPPIDPPPLPFQLQDPEKLRREMVGAELKDVRVEETTEELNFKSGKHFWDWVINSNPVAGAILGQIDLKPDQIETIQRAADDLIRERAAGTGTAVLISPINIGIGDQVIDTLARGRSCTTAPGPSALHCWLVPREGDCHADHEQGWCRGPNVASPPLGRIRVGTRRQVVRRHQFRPAGCTRACCARLDARADEQILDVATGTGWSARNVARTGARVTAVDISSELLAAADDLSAHIHPRITFRLGDAEALPFPDGSFDGVISTFGAIFAQNQQQAAKELGRVCRRGGRFSLATWAPNGSVAKFFAVIAKHSDTPPPQVSRLAWGDPQHIEELLGRDSKLKLERGVNNAYHPDTDHIWERYAHGFGPMRQLIDGLDPHKRKALRADVDAYHRHYDTRPACT